MREASMTRVTGYKCIYDTNNERFKFALTLDGDDGQADFVVSNPDGAETLLDMFEDAHAAHFNQPTGELTFSFDELEADDDEEEAAHVEDDDTDEGEDEASRDAA
jgi:hypothetical protein